MKIDDYRLLIALKEFGTLRSAADKLYISQPAITQRLKYLEEVWGEPLFIRTHKQLIVTPVGEKVLQFAENVVEQEEQLKESINSLSGKVAGKLSLGVSSVVGQYLLPIVLQMYMEKYPNVEIELVAGLSQDIKKSDYHVSIIRGKKMNDRNCSHLFDDRLFLVEKKKNQTNRNTFIAFQSDPSFDNVVSQWLQQTGRKPKQIIKVDQIETCKQMMLSGIGMAVLPESAIQNINKDICNIKRLELEGSSIVRQTWLCYTDASKRLPQVKAFIDMVEEELS
ncbi:LysR family transcriptional regulator [Aquibacillus kalidii]|uniref:LysR family transcriptional regulator n=1 Tax=Aquibacillus kalidii TaxID=2762597 RepID=UPI001647446B|nr:LysR family transcriptional regulator [Aquibacillus kalidii]